VYNNNGREIKLSCNFYIRLKQHISTNIIKLNTRSKQLLKVINSILNNYKLLVYLVNPCVAF